MIKRYYKSLLSLKYALPLTLPAILVFIFAFFYNQTRNRILYYVALAFGIVLLLIFLFVQYQKYLMQKQLRGIKHANDYYNEGAVLNKSFFLETRMLLCTESLKIQELATNQVTTVNVQPLAKDKYQMIINTIAIVVDNKLQAQRLLAFLKRHNPTMTIEGYIDPIGEGSILELKKE